MKVPVLDPRWRRAPREFPGRYVLARAVFDLIGKSFNALIHIARAMCIARRAAGLGPPVFIRLSGDSYRVTGKQLSVVNLP